MKNIEEIKKRMAGKNLEVFFVPLADQTPDSAYWDNDENEPFGEGWFYWYCQPGCIPDTEAFGPFLTEDLAYMDADNQDFEEEEEIDEPEEEEEDEPEEEPEEEELPTEPKEGDYIISPTGNLGSETMVSPPGKIFKGEDQMDRAYAFIRERMDLENWFPDAWTCSDHGNYELVTDLWKEGGKDNE